MIALKRILVPCDFSETSATAVKYAVELARNFGARLYFLHVGDWAQSQFASEFPIGLDASLEEGTRERLLRVLTPQEKAEFNPDFSVRPGSAPTEIVQFAKDANIDLIVMGTHGRGFVGHVVMGSVAEKVVRMAPCPVLTVRNPNHGFLTEEVVVPAISLSA